MTAVPLGQGAYKRLYAGAPEVKLLNRWLEPNPANPREEVSILGRPGTTPVQPFNPGGYTYSAPMRGNYVLNGLFNNSMFIVSGNRLYRLNQDGTSVQISGTLPGVGRPEVAWQQGASYTRLWIADAGMLQYYNGDTAASGTLILSGTPVSGTDSFSIGTTYYKYGGTVASTDDGTSTNPYIILSRTIGDYMVQIVKAINAAGIPGTDYSPGILAANSQVSATYTDSTHVALSAKADGTLGNSVATAIIAGSHFSFGAATLTGGAIGSLTSCAVPSGQLVSSLTQVASYVLLSITGTQIFYWINPGDTTIDSLNFASKESSPDSILSMRTVGDQVAIIGEKSTENWYATGDSTAPFAPIQGRVYARGAIANTPVVVDDAVFMVGDDGRVYSVGYQGGDSTVATWGVNRISNNGIEERIRRQIRREKGLTP